MLCIDATAESKNRLLQPSAIDPPLLGTHSLVWDEAVKISGADQDFQRRDLWGPWAHPDGFVRPASARDDSPQPGKRE